jgi:hypothetical protein
MRTAAKTNHFPKNTGIPHISGTLPMVKTKRQLRKVIKLTHRILNQIKLKMHPD